MRNPDLIPERDSDFATFTNNFVEKILISHAAWEIPLQEAVRLQQAQAPWTSAWAVAKNKNNRTSAQVVEKKLSRKSFEAVLRPFIQRFVIYNTIVTDGERQALGIKPRKKTRTPVGVPDTVPVVSIIRGNGNAVLLYFRQQMNADGSSRRAFPKGMPYVEVAMKVGEPPGSSPDLLPRQTATRSPMRIGHMPQHKGKEIFLCARWRNTKGQAGGWSRIYSFVMT